MDTNKYEYLINTVLDSYVIQCSREQTNYQNERTVDTTAIHDPGFLETMRQKVRGKKGGLTMTIGTQN